MKIHFLVGAGWVDQDGTILGSYAVRYTDGDEIVVPVVYGQGVRDWHFWPDMPKNETEGGSIAWKGTQPKWQGEPDYGARLYRLTWRNPNPAKMISSIDFISNLAHSALFLIAITTE